MEQVEQQHEEAWQEQHRHPSEFVRSLRERIERQRQLMREEQSRLPSTAAG